MTFSSVNTIWVLLGAALVFFMQAGFSLRTAVTSDFHARTGDMKTDKSLAQLAAESASFCYVQTKDLTHRGDMLHYDTASQHELGARYFEAFQQFCSRSDEKK